MCVLSISHLLCTIYFTSHKKQRTIQYSSPDQPNLTTTSPPTTTHTTTSYYYQPTLPTLPTLPTTTHAIPVDPIIASARIFRLRTLNSFVSFVRPFVFSAFVRHFRSFRHRSIVLSFFLSFSLCECIRRI